MVELLPENNIIGYIMKKYGSMFFNGMGGINADGIRFVFEVENIENRDITAQKLLVFLETAQNTQRKETQQEKTNGQRRENKVNS